MKPKIMYHNLCTLHKIMSGVQLRVCEILGEIW
nr:MAG TPA: hypothetical protein [Caudoviricetes sp.]DAS94556.1 MAG TPA: hypothetical protein [Caudoviricetes sp.]